MQSTPAQKTYRLLELGLGASVFQLLLGGFCISLGQSFLDSLGSAINDVLGFLEAETRDFTHGLDNRHLVQAALR